MDLHGLFSSPHVPLSMPCSADTKFRRFVEVPVAETIDIH